MTGKKIRVLHLLSIVGHPRDSKRLSMLLECGFDVKVAAFERNNYKARDINESYQVLGTISHGAYYKRALVFLKAIKTLRRIIKENDVVYCSGLDMLFLSIVSGLFLGKKQAVEVGDIREIQVKQNWQGKIYRLIEKVFLWHTHLIVVTSEAFLTEYFHKIQHAEVKGLVLENKLDMDPAIRLPFKEESPIQRIRIGYFGLLRCSWSLDVLLHLAKSYGEKFEVILAGVIIHQEKHNELLRYDNVTYLGPYKSPEELDKIYSNVDMIWACYQPFAADDYNLRWARPNRFYESCFFSKPLFTRDGCQDATHVKRLNIGLLIDDSDPGVVAHKMAEIDGVRYDTWKQNMLSLPDSIFLYTDELQEIKTVIDDIQNHK